MTTITRQRLVSHCVPIVVRSNLERHLLAPAHRSSHGHRTLRRLERLRQLTRC